MCPCSPVSSEDDCVEVYVDDESSSDEVELFVEDEDIADRSIEVVFDDRG